MYPGTIRVLIINEVFYLDPKRLLVIYSFLHSLQEGFCSPSTCRMLFQDKTGKTLYQCVFHILLRDKRIRTMPKETDDCMKIQCKMQLISHWLEIFVKCWRDCAETVPGGVSVLLSVLELYSFHRDSIILFIEISVSKINMPYLFN